ncbi:MAG: hypothetical protein ACI8RZ_006654 [Myxococcota bacterium]|jgi:hypothetical protein
MNDRITTARLHVRYTSGHRAGKLRAWHPYGDSRPLPHLLAHALARTLRLQGAEVRIEEIEAPCQATLF